MSGLLEVALANAAVATLLAAGVVLASRFVRNPTIRHLLWLVVLVKLVTPPVVGVAVLPDARDVLPAWGDHAGRQDLSLPARGGHAGQQDRSPPVRGAGVAGRDSPTAAGGPVRRAPLAGDPLARVSPDEVPTRRGEDPRFAASPRTPGIESGGSFPRKRLDAGAGARGPGLDGVLADTGGKPAAGAAARSDEPPRRVAGAVAFSRIDMETWLLAAWLAGAAFLLTLTGWRVLRFQREVRRSCRSCSVLERRVASLAPRLGLRDVPYVRVIPARVSPMLWSLPGARPVLLVPETLVDGLSDGELDAVVAHELAHLKRRDHWVRYFDVIVGSLYWWFPVAWWARRRLREEEERACDALVLASLPGMARPYAEGLVKTLAFLARRSNPAPAVATGFGEAKQIKRRLAMIMTARPVKALRAWHFLVLALVACAVLMIYPIRAERGDATDDAAPAPEAPEIPDALSESEREFVELRLQTLELEHEMQALQLERALIEVEATQREQEFELRTIRREADRLERNGATEEAASLRAEAEARREQVKLEARLRRKEIELKRRALQIEGEMQRLNIEEELRLYKGEAEAAQVLSDLSLARQTEREALSRARRERSLALQEEREALSRARREDASAVERETLARRARELSADEGEQRLALAELIRAEMQEERRRHEQAMRDLERKLQQLETQDPAAGPR